MTKKVLNQNGKFVQELIDSIEPDFIFNNNPTNRFKIIETKKDNSKQNKHEQLLELRNRINSIENCNLKNNSKNLVLGDGDINSPLMLIGEAPGEIEDNSGHSFQGEVGSLLKKMLMAINIRLENVYSTYSINFKTPEDKKPSAQELSLIHI